MSPTVVLFPGVAMGHLNPMVELAKLLIAQGFSVTFVIVDFPDDPTSGIPAFVSRVSAAYPSINFHHLPKIPTPPLTDTPTHLVPIFNLMRLSTPHLKDFLRPLSQTADVRGLVVSLFSTGALDAAAELGIPSYLLFTTSASNLAAFLLLPAIESQTTASLKDRGDELISIPGVPPIPASHMVVPLLDRTSEDYEPFAYHVKRLPMVDGIMINTLESLEQRAVRAIKDGLIRVPDRRVPPIYCIGPVVADGGSEEEKQHECLRWLDRQPKGSVVFLCFGSVATLPREQLREIAVGLERSGQRFLWAVRSPRSEGPEPELMPEGFLERTEGRGMVLRSWAPQTAVLRHESVGGFVTHCGWNSTLEAVSAGVPMVAWPLYGEQRMNMVLLVEEAKLAVEMKGHDEELVGAEEIAAKVRWLMESEGGRELRDRAAAAKESAAKAWKDGGPSARAWGEFVSVLKTGSRVDE